MTSQQVTSIPCLDPAPSYWRFLNEHLRQNMPCLISPDLISCWPAFSLWTSTGPSCESDPKPNWEYVRREYGEEIVSVAHCSSREFSDQERETLPLHEVIDLWTSGTGEGLYVKDWHLAKSVRERGGLPFYETPNIFRDDWMQAFWEQEGKDDFRFVYMGVAGTFTPLHRDVYTSYSWSTNITGIKLWRLFPPSVSNHLRRYPDRTSSEIVYDVRDVDCGTFRDFEKARMEMLLARQKPGWSIFIPSGWYHQVENITDAISINHNWCNVNNLPSMYTSLLAATSDVESALSDVHQLLSKRSGNPEWEKEWTVIVQDVLRKDSGWDWTIFWRMIVHNIGQLKDPPLISNPVWPRTPKNLQPPLSEVKGVVSKLVEDFHVRKPHDVMRIEGLTEILDTLCTIIASL